MSVVYFVGNEQDEQAVGPKLDSGKMKLYFIPKSDPRKMIYAGGHRVDEAPSYTLTEAKIDPEYRHINGRNVIVEKTLVPDSVKSLSVNLMLPNKLVSVTDQIYRNNVSDKVEYYAVFLPSNCNDGCDEFFWFGDDATLGSRQITSSMIGWDENEGVITSMRPLRIAGQLKNYYGMEVLELTSAAAGLYAFYVGNENCDSGECPYLTLYRGGAATHAAVSIDGGQTWTAYTTTAISTDVTDAIITGIVEHNGYVVVTYSDVADAVATDGGVAYFAPGSTTAVLSSGFAATTGYHDITVAFNKLWAVGGSTGAGVVSYSCDNGLTWTQLTNTIADSILAISFDPITQLLYLVGEDAEAWVFDGVNLMEITSEVNATAAVDLVSVYAYNGFVSIGGANGRLYENATGNQLDTAYDVTVVGSAALHGLARDPFAVRTMLGSASTVYRRDVATYQNIESFATVAADVTKIVPTNALTDEGTNTFFAINDVGNVYKISYCYTCTSLEC